MAQHGKNYRAAISKVDPSQAYEPREALELAKSVRYANFDETVELHVRTGLDPRHADQQLRGVALLPHGLGKQIRVLVFAQGEAARIAEHAGADYVGADDVVKQIEGGWIDFDVALATPDMMGKVGRLGKILGRRGLMPNPKSGTIISDQQDLPRAISDARKGRVEFRLDRTAIVHVPIGKSSFETDALVENLATIVDAIQQSKPAGAKGQYVRSATIATSMGPGVPLDLNTTLALKVA